MKRTRNPFDPDLPVKVYWNLHRNLYSIQQRGLVVGHTDRIALRDATFKVNQAGRNRVLKEKKKNVHAFVVGFIDERPQLFWDVKIVYNPYKYNSFRLWSNDTKTVKRCSSVLLSTRNGRSEILAHRDLACLA